MNKKVLGIIIAIVILIIIICIIKNLGKKDNIINNQVQANSTNNTFISNNVISEIGNILEIDNSVNNVENVQTKDDDEVKKQEGTTVPAITDKKEEAIKLVKDLWGEDSSVDFVFDYINENGEYVIAVRDRVLATVKNYFKVNLETKNVELDF